MGTRVAMLKGKCPLASLFEQYREERPAAFLDSSLQSQVGRYSIMGRKPWMILREEEGILFENGIQTEGSLEERLGNIMHIWQEKNPTNLPLISGGIGYFSYDYGRKFEQIPTRHPQKNFTPEAIVVFYDEYWIQDQKDGGLYITSGERFRPLEEAVEEAEKTIREIHPSPIPARNKKLAPFQANFEKNEYKDAIGRMIEYIVEGDIYIANMTQQLKVKSNRDPFEVFQYLRHYNPSPFGGYLDYGDFQIISASPERFLQVKEGRVETRPIKGTRKRGENTKEDLALRQELKASEKDRSELLMIVDLERNDLNHVCQPGSVKVTEHFAVEAYATVFHLVSTIQGTLRKEKSVVDLLKAAFPGGSITGAPKIHAMEIIDELEHDRRGIYTGSMGYIGFDGNCDWNIIIRTMLHQDGWYQLGVGGGITCESELEFEYEETLQKAKALLEALSDE